MDMKKSLLAINELVEDYDFINDKLLLDEPSVAQNIQRHLTKMFVLSCGSYYEAIITNAIKQYSVKHSSKYKEQPHGFNGIGELSFFRMFDFGREKLNNVNSFLSNFISFGKEFKKSFIEELERDENKTDSAMAFQEICSMRNSLSHNDLITSLCSSNKSFDDIKDLHNKAIVFVELFVSKFCES